MAPLHAVLERLTLSCQSSHAALGPMGDKKVHRKFAAILLGFPALLLLFAAIATPFLLPDGAAENRALLAQFERTAAFVSAHRERDGRVPEREVLDALKAQWGFGGVAARIQVYNDRCGEGEFEPAANDVFVLGAWRGEWAECYSYPSRRTTLATSVGAFLRKGTAMYIVIWLLLAGFLAWAARTVWPSGRIATAR